MPWVEQRLAATDSQFGNDVSAIDDAADTETDHPAVPAVTEAASSRLHVPRLRDDHNVQNGSSSSARSTRAQPSCSTSPQMRAFNVAVCRRGFEGKMFRVPVLTPPWPSAAFTEMT